MIPVSVGYGILKSQRTLAQHSVTLEKRQQMRDMHQTSQRSWLARCLPGIKF
jgi:Spy/CpxP family protein refolding chaperone